MPSRTRKSGQSSREHKSKDEDYGNSARAFSNGSIDREPVKNPDWNDEQSQDDGGDDHGDASANAVAVVVVYIFVIGLLSRFLSRHVLDSQKKGCQIDCG